jgi:triacylglycerol lipase
LAHADDWYPYYNEDEYTAFYTPPIRCRTFHRASGALRTVSIVIEPSGQVGRINATAPA